MKDYNRFLKLLKVYAELNSIIDCFEGIGIDVSDTFSNGHFYSALDGQLDYMLKEFTWNKLAYESEDLSNLIQNVSIDTIEETAKEIWDKYGACDK